MVVAHRVLFDGGVWGGCFVVVVHIKFWWGLSGGVRLGAAYLGEVLHGFFFVWYDMGVRRFMSY